MTKHPTDQELMCHVHRAGSADRMAELEKHMRSCDKCRQRAEQLQRIDALLRTAASDHVGTGALVAYSVGAEIPRDEKRSIEQHLQFCPRCREELQILAASDAELPEQGEAEATVPRWFDSLLSTNAPSPTTIAGAPTPGGPWRVRLLWPLAAAIIGICMMMVGYVGLRRSGAPPDRVARLVGRSPDQPGHIGSRIDPLDASPALAPPTADMAARPQDEAAAGRSIPQVVVEPSPAAEGDESPPKLRITEAPSFSASRPDRSFSQEADSSDAERARSAWGGPDELAHQRTGESARRQQIAPHPKRLKLRPRPAAGGGAMAARPPTTGGRYGAIPGLVVLGAVGLLAGLGTLAFVRRRRQVARLTALAQHILGERAADVRARITRGSIGLRYRYTVEADAWNDASVRAIFRCQVEDLGPAVLAASRGRRTLRVVADYVCRGPQGSLSKTALEAAFPRPAGSIDLE